MTLLRCLFSSRYRCLRCWVSTKQTSFSLRSLNSRCVTYLHHTTLYHIALHHIHIHHFTSRQITSHTSHLHWYSYSHSHHIHTMLHSYHVTFTSNYITLHSHNIQMTSLKVTSSVTCLSITMQDTGNKRKKSHLFNSYVNSSGKFE